MENQPVSKTVQESAVRLAQVMQPEDANPAGNVHGGTIMKLVDNAAYVVAVRHSRKNCVTLSIDSFKFHYPVYIGDLLIVKASVNFVGNTSMEIGVKIEAEDLLKGTKRHTASAYLTFVALDENGKPTKVPRIIPQTLEEKRRYDEAKKRRELRLSQLK